MRLRTMAGAFAVAIALVATSSQTALADPSPNPGPPEITVTAQDVSPETVVECDFYASKPIHSGDRMTGTGGIATCSGGPAACTSEVDLEVYNDFSNRWMTTATKSQHKCAPPLRSATAAADCIHHSGDATHALRTSTLGTVVSSSGHTASGTAYSDVLYLACE
ncbi:hypothetical protein GCM10022403_006840 [Streptomyces coacervatus]|uniref:Secreted protein n=1 Tax=Streptomyces coacervatus TaxID=647381 RepID=A0ABP7GZ37_9ACTN|nr:hypothetical protein [Streptomyces coacervatus]MDF2272669.1 hypothetical protein [Streptomyces coacervatus]